MARKSFNLFGVPIHPATLDEGALETISWIKKGDTGKLIFTPNPEIILKAKENHNYRRVLKNGSLLIPDGYGLVLASRMLKGPVKKRVTGVDFIAKLFSYAERHRLKCYVVLSAYGLTSPQHARSFFRREYPNLEIHCQSVTVHDRESGYIIDDIRSESPDILIVTFGAPDQEIWLSRVMPKLPRVNVGIAVGGAIDMLAGRVKRAPILFQTLHLEWFWRLLYSPKRAKRIFRAVVVFPFFIAKLAFLSRFNFRKNVLAFVFKDKNSILIIEKMFDGERGSYWVLPQGGVNSGEKEESALLRELREETGAKTIRLAAKSKFQNQYKWPWSAKNAYNFMYAGQKQRCFFVKFNGDKNELKAPKDKSENIHRVRLVSQNELLKIIHLPRRSFAIKLLSEFNERKIYNLP